MASAFRQTLPARLRAAGIHIGLSAVAFAIALYLIVFHWFPGFHFGVDGGWQGVRIMALVDLVLGPTLTLIVFNPLKARRLIVFDLACIGVVQLSALAWGFYSVAGQRPVTLNYYEGIVYSMPARSLPSLPQREGPLRDLGGRPRLLYVAEPDTGAERARAAARMVAGQMVHEDPALFRDFATHWPQVEGAALDPGRFGDPEFKRELEPFLQAHGGSAGDYRFFRYQGGYGSCILALSAAGEVVDALACEAR